MVLSIIIPYYGISELELCKCFSSLEKQSYRNFEVILIKDACDDSLLQLPREYDMLLYKYTLPQHGEIGASMQYGLEHAVGKYVMFLRGDCELPVGSFLAQILLPFTQNKSIEMVRGGGVDVFSRVFLKKKQLTFPSFATGVQCFFDAALLCAHAKGAAVNLPQIKGMCIDEFELSAAEWIYTTIKRQSLEKTKNAIIYFTNIWFYLFNLLNKCAYEGTKEEFREIVEEAQHYYSTVFHYYMGNKYISLCYFNQVQRKTLIQVGIHEFEDIIIRKKKYLYTDIVKIRKEVN